MRKQLFYPVLLLGLALAGPAVHASGWSLAGSVGAEVRWFPDDPAFDDQLSGGQGSLIVAPELRYRTENRRNLFALAPYGRIDGRDDERTHFDVRQASWRRVGSGWELLVGIDRVFWGVTESRHLVDTLNQVDGVENIDGEDRLGQPMISVAFQRDWGRLEAFVLPGFRERTFPGENGRLRFPLVVNTGAAGYESSRDEHRVDLAARWSHYIGDWDVGVHVFRGNGRDPRLLPATDGQSLLPFYDVTTQIGTDIQYTREAWLWKFEGLLREGQNDTFGAAVGGLEYTFYQVGSSAADVGVLFEYLWDDRGGPGLFTPFDNDAFVGSRIAFNDVQDTEILVGAVVDTDSGSVSARLEAERRLGDNLNFEVESQWFADIDKEDLLAVFEQDSYVTARLSFFF